MSIYHKIGHKSNVNHINHSLGETLIFQDHRTILNVLRAAQDISRNNEPFDLVLFDRHDDFADHNLSEKVIDDFLKSGRDQRKLNNIVEFDLSHLDDDWVKVGMELGLINNVFLFEGREVTNCNGFETEYETAFNGKKYYYNLGKLNSALNYQV